MSRNARVVPVILAGGAGSRLWPLSRELFPKQLVPLLSEISLLQQTAWRTLSTGMTAPIVVCGDDHRFVVAEQLRQLKITPRAIVLEPAPRGTASAIAAAAELVAQEDPDTLLLVLPSDHAVEDSDAFREAVGAAVPAALDGHLVTFGVPATRPETGFGYVHPGAALDGARGAHQVERFVEKPTREIAEGYVAEGDWLWNSGMFLLPARLYLDELGRLEPEVAALVSRSVEFARPDLDFVRLEPDSFNQVRSISVDHAVMEHTCAGAVLPTDFGWSDVGSWSALWNLGERDSAGNVVIGDVTTDGSSDCYLRADRVLLATVGLEDTVVVATPDVVLVADRSRAHEVKALVQRLKAEGRPEVVAHRTVYRPWGCYECIDAGEGYQVKHITVKPGQRLSLQTHGHRAEHWAVVSGVAEVVRGEDHRVLQERMSIDIPVGCVHRLGNPGPELLHLIEVQTGDYLGEDDIVRLDDAYGRQAALPQEVSDPA